MNSLSHIQAKNKIKMNIELPMKWFQHYLYVTFAFACISALILINLVCGILTMIAKGHLFESDIKKDYHIYQQILPDKFLLQSCLGNHLNCYRFSFCYSAKSFAFKNKRTTKLLYWWKLSSSLSTYNLFLTCSAWRIFWEFWKWVCCSKTSSYWLPPAIIKWEINITRGTCLKTMRKQIWNKNGHCW